MIPVFVLSFASLGSKEFVSSPSLLISVTSFLHFPAFHASQCYNSYATFKSPTEVKITDIEVSIS